MRLLLVTIAAVLLAVTPAAGRDPARQPARAPLASCSDYPNQAAAQKAADTRDANGDGIYCNDLPCPCAGPAKGSAKKPAKASGQKACTRPSAVQWIGFSKTKYPTIYKHFQTAVKAGWPQILAVNRPYAGARRTRLLQDYETREGYDRDEYPPAVGRGKYRKALMRGEHPRGWKADVAYVPSSENESQGSAMGLKLRRFCNGTRFRYPLLLGLGSGPGPTSPRGRDRRPGP